MNSQEQSTAVKNETSGVTATESPSQPATQNQVPSSGRIMSTRKEFGLFLLIPIVVIALVVLASWLPNLLAHPRYSFIYSYCPEYRCAFTYTIKQGRVSRLVEVSRADYTYEYKVPQLYYYDVARESTRLIDEAEASKYTLDSSSVSADGYRLTQGSGDSSGFLYWGGSGDYQWYLKNGMKKKSVALTTGSYSYDTKIDFLGWVEK